MSDTSKAGGLPGDEVSNVAPQRLQLDVKYLAVIYNGSEAVMKFIGLYEGNEPDPRFHSPVSKWLFITSLNFEGEGRIQVLLDANVTFSEYEGTLSRDEEFAFNDIFLTEYQKRASSDPRRDASGRLLERG